MQTCLTTSTLHKTFEGMRFMCMLPLKTSIVNIDIHLIVFGKCVDGSIKTWGVVKIDVQNKKKIPELLGSIEDCEFCVFILKQNFVSNFRHYCFNFGYGSMCVQFYFWASHMLAKITIT